MSHGRNRLKDEKSPYLLQHAANPVNWLPWGAEAFELAKSQDKPLFFSIGYSSCHWCHVMERECFEDEDVAALLNALVVPVKIDREERPDVDGVYMTACQVMTGSGGWPLSIFADHEGRPFFCATFIAKASRFGRLGMMELLPAIKNAWTARRAEVNQAAAKALEALKAQQQPPAPDDLGPAEVSAALDHFVKSFDVAHGGFGQSPKFPSPHVLLLLIGRYRRAADKTALAMAEKTLVAMRLGGLFDHVGLGFHRYSTDQLWLLPHFEKMLYDQAMLAMAYSSAFAAGGNPLFKATAQDIFAYVTGRMQSPEGAFYSAEDADSEGHEGKFYVWTPEEIVHVLGAQAGEEFMKLYGFAPGGNFRDEATHEKTGANIPHLSAPLAPEHAARMAPLLEKLRAYRENRVAPMKDDKVLTDWNALMIAALAMGARHLEQPGLADAAARAADFVLATLRGPGGRLLHRFRDGQAAVDAFLDDYAFLAWALLELHQTTGDAKRLDQALALAEHLVEHFLDRENGGFFFTADYAAPLIYRRKDFFDAALPSGNSVAVLALARLSRLTGRADLAQHARNLCKAACATVRQYPSGFAMLLFAWEELQKGAAENLG